MANFANFSNSLVSNGNEFSPALVHVNLDISLFRCSPAVEFLRVGSALTPWRKKEAEDGNLHKTACRLGFLFDEILPDTPELLKAFGTRASEILDGPNINPQGTAEDGPFRDFIGADGTCIWAAATSTTASVVPSLGLECMTQRGDFNRWSLALSHLRYYGNPVKVKSEGLLQRVTGDQIWLIALGAILRQWQVDLSNLKDSVIWFGRVGTVIENASQRDAAEISWLRKMCKAVSPFSSASAQEQQILMSLVQFGHRRALRFLGSRGAVQRPYFGLCDLGMFGGNGKHRSVGDACKIAMVQDDAISIHRKRKVGTWTDAPPFSNIFGAHLELQSFRE
ncbi:hypothetical protein CTA2_12790 [Colletotrichum tanaceti]|nr:hypothetical protein CTA2_12790 [Colletotrichum tanaceti]